MRKFIAPSLLAAAFIAVSPAQAAVVIDGFTLDTGTFGAQTGVHSLEGQTGTTVTGYVNQDDSSVWFSTTSGLLELSVNGQGQASINGDPSLENLTVLFEKAWDKVTFNFSRGDTFSLKVNDSTDFGFCSICSLAQGSGQFTLFGDGITKLEFSFDPSITAATQFRVAVPTQAPIPEPATWAMMIVGLGFAGGLIRRRATRVQFA